MDNYFECNFSRVLFFEPLITWIFEDKSNQEMTNLLNFPKPKALVITSNDYNSNQVHQHLVLMFTRINLLIFQKTIFMNRFEI